MVAIGSALGEADTSMSRRDDGRADLYMGDTLFAFRGTEAESRKSFALVVYIWTASVLPLALRKAEIDSHRTLTVGFFDVMAAKPGGN